MKTSVQTSAFAIPLVALACLAGPLAFAAPFDSSVVPPFRGTPCSHYAGWETFTMAFGGVNSPDVAGSTAVNATLEQLLPGAILTSGGNIYHPFAATAFEVSDSVPSDLQEVVLQVSTLGSQRNYGSFILIYTDGGGIQQVRSPDVFTVLEQNPGDEELYFQWDMSVVSDTVLSYTINFIATAPSMSLDAVTLDARWSCTSIGNSFCFGDGTLPTHCPCVPPNTVPNPSGAPGHGCANSLNPQGALMTASGTTAPDTVKLDVAVSGNYLGFGLLLKGNASNPNGSPSSDGILCLSGQLIRFGGHNGSSNGAPAGHWTYPNTVQTTPISTITVQPAGQSAYYQLFYRNAAMNYCNAATANWSNGMQIAWP
jgi:hypothetical protein